MCLVSFQFKVIAQKWLLFFLLVQIEDSWEILLQFHWLKFLNFCKQFFNHCSLWLHRLLFIRWEFVKEVLMRASAHHLIILITLIHPNVLSWSISKTSTSIPTLICSLHWLFIWIFYWIHVIHVHFSFCHWFCTIIPGGWRLFRTLQTWS